MNKSTFTVELESYDLRNPATGEVYHTIPAEKAHVGIVSRRCIGPGKDGRHAELPPETEAAFIRHNGAWLTPLFWFGPPR